MGGVCFFLLLFLPTLPMFLVSYLKNHCINQISRSFVFFGLFAIWDLFCLFNCMTVCLQVYLCTMHMQCPRGAEEGDRSHWPGAVDVVSTCDMGIRPRNSPALQHWANCQVQFWSFNSLTYFELIFFNTMKAFYFILSPIGIQFFPYFFLKKHLSPVSFLATLCKVSCTYDCRFVCGLFILPQWSTSLFLC